MIILNCPCCGIQGEETEFAPCGEAHLATAAKGEATLDHAVARLVEAMAEIDAMPADWLHRKPEV